MAGESKTVLATGTAPATTSSLIADLKSLAVQPGMILIVHSSLSQMGWVCGGPVAVIQALLQAVGSAGTVVMPTFTSGNSDPENWRNPPVPESWWQLIRDTMPAYDADVTPTRMMGVVAETFRKYPGALRSNHPHSSFAAIGRHAHEIIDNHSLEFSLGEESPLARLYERSAWILLLGVGHDNNSSLHLAEYRANWTGKEIGTNAAAVTVNGKRQWVKFDELKELNSDDFEEIGKAYVQDGGLSYTGKVGQADAILVPQAPLIDYAVKHMRNGRGCSRV